MSSTHSSRIAAGFLTNLLQYGGTMLLQLVLAPVVLRFAEQETLGAYFFLMQAVSWAALTDLGFGVAISRSLAQAYGLDDGKTRFFQILSTGRTFYLGSNLVMAIAILVLGLKADSLMQMSAGVAVQAQHALFILAAWVFCRTPLALFDTSLHATQRMATVNLVVAICTIFRLTLALVFVWLGAALVGMVIAFVIGEALSLVACRVIFQRQHEGLRAGWGISNWLLFREMFAFGLTYLFMGVASRLSANTDSLVVGAFLGPAAVAIYYTSQTPALLLSQLVWKLADNASPAMNELFAAKQGARLTEIYLCLLRYSLLASILVALGVFAFNRAVVTAWVGDKQYAGGAFSLLVGAFVVSQVINHLNAMIMVVHGRLGGMTIVCVGTGLLKVVMAVALAKPMGLSGVMLANLVADLCFLIYLCQRCGLLQALETGRIWDEVLRPCLLAGIFPGLATFWLISSDNVSYAVLSLAMQIVGISLVWFIGGWLFGLKPSERTVLVELVRKFLKTR